MSTREIVHEIILDPHEDAWQAGICECDACTDGYMETYRTAIEDIERRNPGHRIRLLPGSYHGPSQEECDEGCQGECASWWQEAHDLREWVESPDCEHIEEEEEVTS